MNKFYADFIFKKFYDLNSANVLELGVGEELNFAELCEMNHFRFRNYTGIDISDRSISIQKNKIYTQEVNFYKFDFSKLITHSKVKFNLIIDSHLLHCLMFREQQRNYLLNIHKNLESDGGVAFFEVMVESKKFEKDYSHLMNGRKFNEDYQARYLFYTHELEELLCECGFKIEYFCVEDKFQFQLNEQFDSYVDLARILVRRKT